jgi:hypothetical protein
MAGTLFSTGVISDDATFRAAGKLQSDAIVSMGLVRRTAGEDSGQIDWATVARPIANTSAGYEVFRFADALQATAPVLIKIIWGCGAITSLRYIVQVGFATDGAGTLTGYTSFAGTFTTTAALTASSLVRISGSTNRLCFASNVHTDVLTSCDLFSIERTHNAAGGDTAQGVFFFSKRGNIGNTYSLLTYAGGELDYRASYAACLAPSVGHGSTGTQTMVFPIFPAAGPFLNPMINCVGMFVGNITVGVPLTITILGSARTYIPLPTAGFAIYCYSAALTLAMLMRTD